MGVFLCLNVWGQLDPDSINNRLLDKEREKYGLPYILDAPTINIYKKLNTFMISACTTNMYDTYLSPLKYKAFPVRLLYEMFR